MTNDDAASAELDTPRDASAAAARWRKVARRSANLHRAALIGASHTELIAAVAEVTAATQEPTP